MTRKAAWRSRAAWVVGVLAITALAGCTAPEPATGSSAPSDDPASSSPDQPTDPSTDPSTDPEPEDPFFVDPGSPAYEAWLGASGEDKLLLARIALTPGAYWVTRTDPAAAAEETATYLAAAQAAGSTGLIALYGIPDRDCGGWSEGGTTPDEYPAWVSAVAGVLVPGTWVVLEPDALAMIGECSDADERLGLLRQAAHDLAAAGGRVYVDVGHPHWLSPQDAADRLRAVGVGDGDGAVGELGGSVRGFSLNVSNFVATDESLEYGRQVAALLGGGHFVVDTSRNGRGDDGTWCNPPGRGLGASPQLLDDPVADALVWVKRAGESDGSCNGGPEAGAWWLDQALQMAADADLTSRWAFRPPSDAEALGGASG